jgi:YidC/Oxa1 family membrane protein insertase
MDRRFVLALLVSLLFVMLYYGVIAPWLFPKPPAPPPGVGPETRKTTETPVEAAPTRGTATTRPVVDADTAKPFTIENKDLRLHFSRKGGVLVKAELLDYKQSPYAEDRLDLLKHYADPPPGSNAIPIPKALELRDLGDAASQLESHAWERVASDDPRSVTFVLGPGIGGFSGNYRVTKTIRLPEAGRHADVVLALEHLGSGVVEKPCRLTLSGGVSLDADTYGTHDLTGAESIIFQEDPQEGEKLEKVTPLDMGKVEPKPGEERRKAMAFNGRRRFVADINNYFGVYCGLVDMPARMEVAFVGNVDPAEDPARARVARTRVDLEFKMISEAGKRAEHKLLIYFGPNETHFIEDDLAASHPTWAAEFSRVYGEALGMFAWIGKGVLYLLKAFDKLAGNWGVAIMLLTFFVRLVLFPVNRRSQISMVRHSEAMGRIKPRLDALKEKYKNDARKFLAEQQALMKAEKVPLVPLGGCLPLLLQIPIFYGLFAALRASIELRQAPFLWAADLSQPDHLVRFDTPFSNPFSKFCCCAPPGMSDTISGIHLLPLLMTAAWFVNQLMMPKPVTEDPQMAQQRKMMMFLPVMMGLMMYGYGAGLSLYWLTSSLLGIIESRIIKRGLPKRPPAKAAAAG